MKKEEIITTPYISGQEYFCLPDTFYPKIRLEIYNENKKEWRINEYQIYIRPLGEKKKTDKTIKLIFNPLQR